MCEIVAGFDGKDAALCLFTKEDGSGGLRIGYDAGKKTCMIDRTGIDRSSVEIFANDGAAVFTTHLYPTEREFNYTASGIREMEIWALSASVIDDFVV